MGKKNRGKGMRVSAKVLFGMSFMWLLMYLGMVFISPLLSIVRQQPSVPKEAWKELYKIRLNQIIGIDGLKDGAFIPLVVFVGLFCIFGIIAHVLMSRDLRNGAQFSKGETVIWIISFLPYVVPFALLLVILAIVKFIDIMIGLFTGGEKNLKSIIDFLLEASGFKKKNKGSGGGSSGGTYYTVYDNGHERTLTFVEYTQDLWMDSPFHLQNYNRFRDDLGNYWRSYDDNNTFIKEKEIPNNVGSN